MRPLAEKFGIWTNVTDAVLGHLHEIQGLGFDYLVVRVVHREGTSTVPHSPAAFERILTDAATIGLKVIGWAYVFPDNIQAQINGIAAALPAGIDHLILDAEVEWEHKSADDAHALMHGLALATGHRVSFHLSGFCNPIDHPIPLEAFLSHCQSFMPQAYHIGSTPTSKVMDRVRTQCKGPAANSLGKQLIPTINAPEMLPLMKDRDFAGVNVWLWHDDPLPPQPVDDKGVQNREALWTPVIADYSAWKSTNPI